MFSSIWFLLLVAAPSFCGVERPTAGSNAAWTAKHSALSSSRYNAQLAHANTWKEEEILNTRSRRLFKVDSTNNTAISPVGTCVSLQQRHLEPPLQLYELQTFDDIVNSCSHTDYRLHRASKMSAGIPKTFWSSPIRYLRWASYEKPAIFWSVVVGAMGPVFLVAVPPLRRMVGDKTPPRIPLTYPVPEGPRKIPEGYDDPK